MLTQQTAQRLVNDYQRIGQKMFHDEGNHDAVYQVDEAIAALKTFATALAERPVEEQRMFFVEMYGVVEGSNTTEDETEDYMVAEMVAIFYDFYPRFDGAGMPSFDHLVKGEA